MTLSVDEIYQRLEQVLQQQGQVALAVSGGVDSMTLATIACKINPASQVFHALSAAVPVAATLRVQHYALKYQWQLQEINAGEMDDPSYQRNPSNRCYFCKNNLYGSIRQHTVLPIVSGTNLDDLEDYRPGLIAANEHAVRHPLVEAGINKNGVRQLAAWLGLDDLRELPASPCLSSRITTGIAIDADLLPLIDQTEQKLRLLLNCVAASDDIRCRIRNTGITIQLSNHELALEQEIRSTVQKVFSSTRFSHYCRSISIEPYEQGSAFIKASI